MAQLQLSSQAFCNLSMMVVQVPVCLVSIVDDDHQWFKSNQGLACSATDRKSSFCAWTLLPQHPELLIVEDALEDARYSQLLLHRKIS